MWKSLSTGSNLSSSCLPELWNDGLHSRKNKKKDPFCPVKKKKPVVVSDILFPSAPSLCNPSLPVICATLLPGAPLARRLLSPTPPHLAACFILTSPSRPYIVYMLQDLDILEDWTAIRKVFCRQTELHGSTNASFAAVWASALCLRRRWHRWGPTGWRWTVRVSPCPRLQSISGWVRHRLAAAQEGVDSALWSKRTWAETRTPWPPAFPSLTFLIPPPHTAAPAVKPDRHHHVARSEDGRLFYDNQWYCRGQAICINKKDDYPTRCVCVWERQRVNVAKAAVARPKTLKKKNQHRYIFLGHALSVL